MKRIFVCLALVSLVALSGPRSIRAADDGLEFLHAMQDRGYPDIALDYLKMLKERSDAPKEIMDVWELEMSRSCRAASKLAYNEAQAKQLMSDAEKYLQSFIKANPDRPEAIRAAAWWADNSGQEALRLMAVAKFEKDADKKAEMLEKAKTLLGEVRPHFKKAADSYRQSLADLPAKDTKKRSALESQVIESTLKVALTDFYLAQTIVDPASADRKAAMEKASKEFDSIYKLPAYRATLYGLQAHFLDGWVKQEQGDLENAKEIFEEVLGADAPDVAGEEQPQARGRRTRGAGGMDDYDKAMAQLFAETEQHYLQCILKESAKEYIKEAVEWRKQHKGPKEALSGFQAISFELARNLLKHAEGEKVAAAEKKRYTDAALQILKEMVRVPSPYQQEAVKLRRQLGGGGTGEAGMDEAIAEADERAGQKDWKGAIEAYQKAYDAAAKGKDKDSQKKAAAIQNAIAGCNLNMAHDLFRKNKLDEASKKAQEVVEQFPDTPTASLAAELGLNIARNQFATVVDSKDSTKEDKDAALKQLIEAANAVKDKWPGKPVADVARMCLMQLSIEAGKLDDAYKVFKEINPQSEHYGTATFLLARTFWGHYVRARRAAESAGAKPSADEQKQWDDDRKKALGGMQKAVTVLKATPTNARTAKVLQEAARLLGDMHLDANDYQAAVDCYQPLIDDFLKEKGEKSSEKEEAIDPGMLMVFKGAVDAYVQLNEMEKAAKVAESLLKLGPDNQTVNSSLMGFARKLDVERKKLDDEAKDAVGGKAAALQEKRDSFENLLKRILENLAERKKYSVQGKLWTARACVSVRMSKQAKELCESVIEAIESETEKIDPKAEAGVRTMLVAILRQEGKYGEAQEQVQALMAKNKRALEPRIEMGFILQARAEKEPDYYPKAVTQWERLRRDLEQVTAKSNEKTKPGVKSKAKSEAAQAKYQDDLYQITFQEALCLHDWSKHSGDKEHAKTALQMLKQTMLLDPKLNGRETVNRYKGLINKLETLLGIEPSGAKSKDARKP